MAKTAYLVDTENVGSNWTKLLDTLNKQDTVILFYTKNSPGIEYGLLGLVSKHYDLIRPILCYEGKNGLDFQLVSQLGFLIKGAPKTNYVIVSNDTGFDVMSAFWATRGTSVTRKSTADINAEREKVPETAVILETIEYAPQRDQIMKILQEVSVSAKLPNSARSLYTIIIRHCRFDLVDIHRDVTMTFRPNGVRVYQKLKPHLGVIYDLIDAAREQNKPLF